MIEVLQNVGMNFLRAFSAPGTGEIYLTIAFIFTSVLLLGLLLHSKWDWRIKAGSIVLSIGFYALIYFSVLNMQGWPTHAPLPDDMELAGSYIDPPNKSIGKDGFIVIWVLDREDLTIGKKPRAHILPYDKKLHKDLQKAKQQQEKSGQKSAISKIPMKGTKKGKERPTDSTDIWLKVYNLPPGEVPTK